MELGTHIKRGALPSRAIFTIIIAFIFLLSIASLIQALTRSHFGLSNPLVLGTNFSGVVVVRANLTNGAGANNITSGEWFNITNVSFYAKPLGGVDEGALILIGINTTANLTTYAFTWNTNNGNFADNLSYLIIANASGTNMTSAASVMLDSTVTTIGVDNRPPEISFFGSNGRSNPDSANFINSTPVLLSFNFTVTDRLFTDMVGMCRVAVDFANSTLGANLSSRSGGYLNNTFFNLSSSVGAALEGRHSYRVECIQDASTNLTGNSTTRTLVIDLTKPSADIAFLDLGGVEQTSFGPNAEVKVECRRNDPISGFNRTEIFVRSPSDSSPVSKKVDTASATFGTSQFTTEHIIPSEETQQLGEYFIECAVDDQAGNRFTNNKTFEITTQAPSSSSAFKVPGFSAPVGKIKVSSGVTADGGRLSTEGLSRLMQVGASLKLDIKGIDHTITVAQLADESVTLNIASEPITITVQKEQTVDVDLDKDGTNDLAVTFHKRFPAGGKHADLTFSLVSTPSVVTEEDEGQTTPPPTDDKGIIKASKAGLIVTILVIVVIIVVGYFMLGKKKK